MVSKFLMLVSLASCISCATMAKPFHAKVVKSEGSTHILEYFTGTEGGDWEVYDESYIQTAREICKGSHYKVLERAHVPTAFKCAESVLDPTKFYWVIECEK